MWSKNGTPVELTQKEYDLLSYLIRERGKVFSREDLMQLFEKAAGQKIENDRMLLS